MKFEQLLDIVTSLVVTSLADTHQASVEHDNEPTDRTKYIYVNFNAELYVQIRHTGFRQDVSLYNYNKQDDVTLATFKNIQSDNQRAIDFVEQLQAQLNT